MAKKEKQPEFKPSDLEEALAKVFSNTWPVSRNFREKIRPIIEPLLKQIEDLKKECYDNRMAVYNIVGELSGADWSDEPTEAMTKQLRDWSGKYHEMKQLIANDGFVPYSTGDRGYPFIVHDEKGRGKLLLVRPDSGSSPIRTHGDAE